MIVLFLLIPIGLVLLWFLALYLSYKLKRRMLIDVVKTAIIEAELEIRKGNFGIK